MALEGLEGVEGAAGCGDGPASPAAAGVFTGAEKSTVKRLVAGAYTRPFLSST